MSIEVEVQSNIVEERGGTIRKGDRVGERWSMRQQEAWLHNGRVYPERFVIALADTQAPYPPGRYELAPSSIEVGEYSKLQFARELQLLKLTEPKASPQKASVM